MQENIKWFACGQQKVSHAWASRPPAANRDELDAGALSDGRVTLRNEGGNTKRNA